VDIGRRSKGNGGKFLVVGVEDGSDGVLVINDLGDGWFGFHLSDASAIPGYRNLF